MRMHSINLFKMFGMLFLIFPFSGMSGQSKSILLVIDMQANLLKPGKGGLHVDSLTSKALVENVNNNIRTAASLYIPVAYIQNEWTNPFVNYFTNNVCKKGAAGTEFDPRLLIVDSLVFHKSVPNSFSNKELLRFIERDSINTIYITGIMVEGCVGSTARNSIKKGFQTILIVPAIGSSSASKLKKGLQDLFKKGAKPINGLEHE
jgi:nicotinamidase-related amidase